MHEILSRPGALVLAVSPGERQSKLLFKKMIDLYRALGRPVAADAENRLSLELANGSQIHALPGAEDKVRGFSGVTLLLVDEASRVPDPMMAALRPMLSVNGGPGWERFEIPATACPRIDPAFLEEERRALGPLFFASEYECRFVETVDAVFRYDDIAAALDEGVAPLFGGPRVA